MAVLLDEQAGLIVVISSFTPVTPHLRIASCLPLEPDGSGQFVVF